MTISAATLAGGEKNQDRYAYGDDWAFVLDGASSFATDQPEHDGGWYAERLKNALVEELTSNPDDATTDIVARAIDVAASAHDDPETCPTSTIALARWSSETVEAYVLGDSTVALIGEGDETVLTNTRVADVAPSLRKEYRSRLRQGHGFDEEHRALLQDLQEHQAMARNRPGGYWIAGAEPKAANKADLIAVQRDTLTAIVLASDGAASCVTYKTVPTWGRFAAIGPHNAVHATHAIEAADSNASQWPRSKPHDDKTAIVIDLSGD
ncbi:hypothetical protein [Janibacter alittae]|uniref:PPM-type phosphatase domain-containing protein n=1 Tax=Janibacter alittae TaxID=3115209 RepID=A0ABZ2MIE2_9MICO